MGAVWSVPEDPAELRIAAASCQHFETGFYAAHRDIAEWAPDLVLFLGDFIYEYGGNPVGGEVVRTVDGAEVMSTADYRARYAQYLGDPDLQASRAVCPWVVIWDDHEVENNYAGVAPEHIADMPTFAVRRLVAYQVWWENMPVRGARPASLDDITIYRTIAWGGLADLIMLDGRKYRTNQACNDVVLSLDPPCPTAAEPARTMLGAEQEQWLADQLAATTAIWPVIGQQTLTHRRPAERSRAELRPVGRLRTGPGSPARRGKGRRADHRADRRHPPCRRRRAARRRGRIREHVDQLARARAG